MSSASRANRIEELFSRAAELAGPERSALLAERRVTDPDVVAEVERLLAAEQLPAGLFLSRPLWSLDRAEGDDDLEAPVGVGGYRIDRTLGKGGMGAVYLSRHAATGRLVALKLLRPGVGSPRHLERFRLEAETLARLSEPRIAQLYDSGMARVDFADGARAERPFIAMEYVSGRSIVQEAVARGLGVPDRLKMMEGVARAVQYAHQRGVIHRDLKPSNILVAEDGTPKVVDFGIARLLDANDEALTLTGQVLGTTRYMSPEQATGNNAGVDTRSDVYSLGAVLYELLAERPIIDVESASSFSVMAQVLQARPPRLGTLNPAFRGDIEAVVHKAVEREPEDRYQSAGDLADDLARLLSGEPVSARTPTTVERLFRGAKRNKPLSAAVGAAVLAMIAGTSVSMWQARAAKEQAALARDEGARASEATREAQGQARLADQRAAEALHQRDLVIASRDTLAQGIAQWAAFVTAAASRSSAVRESLLDSMRETLLKAERAPRTSPMSRASAYDAFSTLYEALGEFKLALEWREKTVRLLEDDGHPEDVLLLTNRAMVASLTYRTDPQADVAECERVIRDCRRRLLPEIAEGEAIQVRLAQDHSAMLERLGRFEESEKNYQRLLTVMKERGWDAYMIRHVTGLLGTLYRKAERPAEALPLLQSVVDGLESEGASGIDIAPWLENLGFVHEQLGENEKALEAYDKMNAINQRVFGDQDLRTALGRYKLARVVDKLGSDDDQALRLYTESLGVLRQSQPARWRELCNALNGLCGIHLRHGRADAAEPYLREALGLLQGTPLETDPLFHVAQLNEARLLRARGDAPRAEAALLKLHETVGDWERTEGVGAGLRKKVAAELADLYEAQGKREEAATWRKRAE